MIIQLKYILTLCLISSSLSYAQNAVVAPVKMNVLYTGVDNPLNLAVENYSCSQIFLCAEYGTLQKTNDSCKYIYRAATYVTGKEFIYAGVYQDSSVVWIDTLHFRVKPIPRQYAYAGTTINTLVRKQDILKNPFVSARCDNLDLDYQTEIMTYSFILKRDSKIIFEEKSIQGCGFTPSIISQISNAQTGDKLMFFDVFISNNYNNDIKDTEPFFVLVGEY